jgi:glycerol-3-phosphate dehydrogenase
MKRSLSAFAGQTYDIVVVGGGIYGACAAWEAAARGLSVALVERGDFAHATSNNHFRMVHGGIRYLQHGDLARVRESSRERSTLLKIAPHLVYPLPIVVPTYGHGRQGKELLGAGMLLYDAATLDRNRGIGDTARQIPPGRTISRRAALELFPYLGPQGLTGAAIFHDGQIYNPARLVLAFLQSAARAGADVANYVEAVELLRERDRVIGVRARDALSGAGLEVRGRMVINAAGPWAPRLLRQAAGIRLNPAPAYSRDACFVTRRRITDRYALSIQGRTKDPDALLSRGNRHLFVVPWQEYNLIGVWHVVHQGDPDEVTVSEADLSGFIAEFAEACPGLDLSLNDVGKWMAGLTLFGENAPGQTDLSYGKRSQIIDHAQADGVPGLITLLGVRFTTARGVAERAIDLALAGLGRPRSGSATSTTPVHGGDIADFEAFARNAAGRHAPRTSEGALASLLHNHGTAYYHVLDLAAGEPCLAGTLGASHVLKAEVAHAVRREMAVKLGDVVWRRTNLGAGGPPGQRELRECAALMAAELGWDAARTRAEIQAVAGTFPGAPEKAKAA